MIDYESLILAKQEAIEIYEDEPDSDFFTESDLEFLEAILEDEE